MSKRQNSRQGFTRHDLLSGSTKVAALAGLSGAAASGALGFKSAKAAEAARAEVAPGSVAT